MSKPKEPREAGGWRSLTRTGRLALELFEPKDRRLLFGLVALFILMALVQTLSVASILPFMSLVGNPEVITENRWLEALYDGLGFTSTRAFLIFAGILVLLITALSAALNALTNWAVIRFGWNQQYSLCVRLLSGYLAEPYDFFLVRNTSELAKTMFSEVTDVISNLIIPGMKMIAHAIVVLSLFLMLLLVDPLLSVISTFVLGGAYGGLYGFVRREQARLGRSRVKLDGDRYRAADEALKSVKESKLLERERAFVERFAAPAREFARANSRNLTVIEVPRYGLETLVFGGMLWIVLYVLATREDIGDAIAVVSLYALAGYRLMPAFQLVFTGLTRVRFYRAALENVHQYLSSAAGSVQDAVASLEAGDAGRLPFRDEIRIENLRFRYPATQVDVLKDVNLEIPYRAVVGFVGGTGSGKTTLVDLILGLLSPSAGRIVVDSSVLSTDNQRRWSRNLGYVPQDIFLCDDTIARNIALGLPDEAIDFAAVQKAATISQIHDFVSALPDGYETRVGERGVRLSGGQRQRIGIARALYHDPEVLILDEATSALDGITEDALMDAILELAGKKTMLLIAHRVTTLRNCDTIHVLRDGRLTESGTYDELIERSTEFRAMAKMSEMEATPVSGAGGFRS